MAGKEYMHYQEYFKNYLGAWSVTNGDEVVTIKRIGEEEMFDAQTGEKKSGLCVWFHEKELPMVLNVTNAQTISEVLGTDIVKNWIGKKVILGTSKVKAFGKVVEALRIRDRKPVAEKATAEQVQQIQQLISAGAISDADAMLKYYGVARVEDLPEDTAANLIKAKAGKPGKGAIPQ